MNDHYALAGLLVLAYLAGSIPASYLAGRLAGGIDLRTRGSGNLGATNVVRVLGWGWAVPVAIFDVGKGFFPLFLALTRIETAGAGLDRETAAAWTVAIGLAAIVGHVFSVWVRFKGGKGVATAVGAFLALAPAALGAAVLVWLVVVLTTRYVSAGSVAALASLPLFVHLFEAGSGSGTGSAPLILALLAMALGIWAHRANIGRLVRGTENRFGKREPT